MRKLLIPALATALVMGVVVAGTWAFFSDTEASSGNTFSAGTLDLKMRRPPPPGMWSDGITTAVWSMSDMVPGVTTTSGSIDLKNVGSIPADHLEISCSYTVDDDPDVESDTDKETWLYPDRFARYMEITSMRYYKDGWYIDGLTGERRHNVHHGLLEGPYDKWQVEDQDEDDIISLYDLKNDGLDDLPFEGVMTLAMSLKFHESAGNDLQGDTLHLTMIFTLNQEASQ